MRLVLLSYINYFICIVLILDGEVVIVLPVLFAFVLLFFVAFLFAVALSLEFLVFLFNLIYKLQLFFIRFFAFILIFRFLFELCLEFLQLHALVFFQVANGPNLAGFGENNRVLDTTFDIHNGVT